MKKNEILELLEEAKGALDIIRNYKKISRPKVNSILLFLRSSLDYAAQDIGNRLIKPRKGAHFPYGESKQIFDSSISKNLPNLDEELPEIYSLIEALQGFHTENHKLAILCKLNNKTKHNEAINVISDEECENVQMMVDDHVLFEGFKGKNAPTIHVTGAFFNGKKIDDIIYESGELNILKKGEVSINYKITKDRKIIIGDLSLDLISFLDYWINEIEKFIEDLYLVLYVSN
ncbi:hypothetical protein F7R97_12725 [Acinetobacter baumannii]|uniref:hypothetical protein n=1 Tax=Acinetobacter baumannii TaxID=470 RepID=UPI0015B9FCB2|nr:hypothetical protein [Acinetobacter baumannii]QLF07369.1 hypothetical protein F7R97_12725 [Acinetobacter baumannii]